MNKWTAHRVRYTLTWQTFATDRAVARNIQAGDMAHQSAIGALEIPQQAHIYSNHYMNQGQGCEYDDQGAKSRKGSALRVCMGR